MRPIGTVPLFGTIIRDIIPTTGSSSDTQAAAAPIHIEFTAKVVNCSAEGAVVSSNGSSDANVGGSGTNEDKTVDNQFQA